MLMSSFALPLVQLLMPAPMVPAPSNPGAGRLIRLWFLPSLSDRLRRGSPQEAADLCFAAGAPRAVLPRSARSRARRESRAVQPFDSGIAELSPIDQGMTPAGASLAADRRHFESLVPVPRGRTRTQVHRRGTLGAGTSGKQS